jgi:hypothetical protein
VEVSVSDPLVPETVMVYWPNAVSPLVVIVSETVASGVATVGLGVQTGRLLSSLEVTVHVRVTGLAKPVVVASATVAVAVPPGSMPALGDSCEGVSVKFCA